MPSGHVLERAFDTIPSLDIYICFRVEFETGSVDRRYKKKIQALP